MTTFELNYPFDATDTRFEVSAFQVSIEVWIETRLMGDRASHLIGHNEN